MGGWGCTTYRELMFRVTLYIRSSRRGRRELFWWQPRYRLSCGVRDGAAGTIQLVRVTMQLVRVTMQLVRVTIQLVRVTIQLVRVLLSNSKNKYKSYLHAPISVPNIQAILEVSISEILSPEKTQYAHIAKVLLKY